MVPRWPPKVSGRNVPALTAAPPWLTPTVAAPTTRGSLPKALEMRARTAKPPTAGVTSSLTVASEATPYPHAIAEPHATCHLSFGLGLAPGRACRAAALACRAPA